MFQTTLCVFNEIERTPMCYTYMKKTRESSFFMKTRLKTRPWLDAYICKNFFPPKWLQLDMEALL